MKKVTIFSIFFLSFFIGAGLFLAQNKASAATTLPRVCSVSITSPSNYQVVNPNQDLTISYTITCSAGRFIRANIYFTSTGDPYTQYNPSSHCAWTFQVSGTSYYSVTYPSAGLLRAKQIEGSTAHFYVDVNEYARDDNPPGCSLNNSAYYAFQDLRWVRFEEPPTRYACNTSTWQCYESSTGPYTSLSSCQANCQAPSPCIINSFTANPNPVSYNGSTSLSWSTSNCTSCTASASPSNIYWYGSKSTSGSTSIYNLTQTTTFTLSCAGSSGSDTKSVTVNVQTPSLNVSCNASPNPAQVNQIVTFTANVSGGVSPYSYSWSGAVSGNSQSVNKTFSSSGTYTAYLTVTDSASQTKTTSCSVVVQETTRQISLSANPLTVDYNGSTVLSWSASGYDSCQGYAEPRNSQWDTSVSFSGTKTITNLTQTTTFYLKCYYNFISNYDIRSVTVNVNSQIIRYACNTSTWQCYESSTGPYTSLSSCQANCQAPSPCIITNFTANPNPVSYNGNTVLTWTTNNCTSCTASSNPSNSYWYGNKNTNGSSIVYNLTQTTTFTLTCAGYNNTDTKSITVSTSQIPALNVSCYASPNPAQINQTVTFYSTVSGGSGNYYYSWAGYAYGSSSSYSRSFSSGGTYWAYLTVTDSDGRSGSASCSVYIESPVNYPTLDFWADKYTLIKGESTYLRWSSFNTTYCTASNGWSGTKSTAGYESASPLNQTTYTLTCYGPNGSVTKSLTLYVVSPSKNISISKLGRNLTNGDRTYEKTFRLADGEVAEFYLVVSAGSNGDLTNVLVKDILPPSLSYRLGTTKVDGVLQPDTITTTGLSLGTIPRNTSKIITFQATGSAPGSYVTQINTAEATATGQDKVTDTASIVFGVVLGAATVKTGPADSLIFLLGISFGISLLTWYYLTYNPKGKLLYLRIGNKLREMRFNRLRKKILKEKE